VVIGAGVGGIFGALIAAPVLATGRVLAHYVNCKMRGVEPFPPGEPAPAVPKATTSVLSWKRRLEAARAWWAARRAADGPPTAHAKVSEVPGIPTGPIAPIKEDT
jgi:hypothetical protein